MTIMIMEMVLLTASCFSLFASTLGRVLDLVAKMPVKIPTSHIRMPVFYSQFWFLTLVSDQCASWEATTMTQLIGFLLCLWEPWVKFPTLTISRLQGRDPVDGNSLPALQNK